MTNERNALADLFSACWKDDALKARFMSAPKAVLAEHGIDVPQTMDVNVIENSDTCMNITMPAGPAESSALTDAELSVVAGGGDVGPTTLDFCLDPNARGRRSGGGFGNFFMNR